jgi:wyosine [tRNA(Phe)-imidazoG37] synthetase (radical SAM superfamily)
VEDGKFFTESKTDQVEIYTPLEIVRELEKALEKKPEIDYVTFSGNGEPTLHPQFLEICSELRELRNRYMPNLPIALLSNSTCLHRTDVLEAINFIDLPILKLDCGNQKIFQIINRPVEGISFGLIVEALSKIESPVLQSVFVDGKFSNATKEAVREWIDVIEKIKPHAIQIYSIDRPLPHSGLVPVKVERLNEIASLVKSRVSCRAEVFIE